MQKIALLVIALLLLSGFAMSVSDEDSASASVTVNQFVSITLTDYGTSGLDFQSLNPGTNDNPEKDQNADSGAVGVANDAISNVTVNLYVKGDNFCTDYPTCAGDTIAVTYVEYNAASTTPGTGLTASYVDTTVDLAPSASQDLWYWIDVPSGQAAGSYSSSFAFKGDTV